MKIEKTDKALEQVWRLWKDCFQDTDEYMDFYFQWKMKDNVILGSYDEEKLVSMVQLNPYELSVQGEKTSSYYIVGVATDAQYRKRGLMRQLLTEAMNRMYEEEVPFTYLMPAKEAIYLPFDFRIVTTQKRYNIQISSIVERKKEERLVAASIAKDTAIRYQEFDVKDEELLQQLANFANERLSQTEDVFTTRNSFYYQRMMAELSVLEGGIIIAKQSERIKGYLAYDVEMGRIEVLESICEPEYESGLIEELEQRIYHAYSNEEQEATEPTIAPPMMTRIIHLPRFLEFIRATKEVELILHAKDEFILENQGYYQMKCNPDGCSVTKLDGMEYDKRKTDITGDIASLTRLFFGRLSIEDAKSMFEEMSERFENSFEQLVFLENTYLNEIV